MGSIESFEDIKKYSYRYRPKGLILDTNILLLLLAGKYKKSGVKNIKKIKNYSIEEFELLKEILKIFKNNVIIVPQVIAEISNLSITKKILTNDDHFNSYIDGFIKFIKSAKEHHHEAKKILGIEVKIIKKFGFTDMTLLELSTEKDIPILTDDYPFFKYAYKKTPVIKFSHIVNKDLQDFLNSLDD